MKTAEPLSWLDNNKDYKEELISWFNNKMDELVIDQNLTKFNNDANTLSDVVDSIKDMALIAVAPVLGCTQKEFQYYFSLTSKKDDLVNLTYRYCEQKFDKVSTT
jgi:hypothetical protein